MTVPGGQAVTALSACFGLALATAAEAQIESILSQPATNLGLAIEDPDLAVSLSGLFATHQLLRAENADAHARAVAAFPLDLFYVSGPDTIVAGRVQPEALAPLGAEVARHIAGLETNTDVCYVQGLTFTGGEAMVIGVHNTTGGDTDDVFRCFTALLWRWQTGSLDGLDTADWQRTLSSLITLPAPSP